jgi:hypothetical protein
MSLRLAMAGVVACGCATLAHGAVKSKKPPPPKLALAVNLENKRLIALLSFEIVMPAKAAPGKAATGKDTASETIVAKLEKPLSPGASASLPLLNASGCVFEARWRFEDASDAGPVDLCSDAHIVLVD